MKIYKILSAIYIYIVTSTISFILCEGYLVSYTTLINS